MPMIGGYRKIAAKHGITLVADVVRENDAFDWTRMPPRIEHKPALGDRGESSAPTRPRSTATGGSSPRRS
jgi:hypothetical protein